MIAISEIRRAPTPTHLERTKNTPETRANWLRWALDPDIRQWMSGHIPSNERGVERWMYLATNDARRHYFDIHADGKAIGFINLRQDHAPKTTGEIGIVIGEAEYRSRGIGSQALDSMLAYAKNDVHLTSVRALIKPTNEKSIRLFVKKGFVQTGTATIDGEVFLRFEKTLQENPSHTVFSLN